MSDPLDLSVLSPAKNEVDNLPSLLMEIRTALTAEHYEVLVVDDGIASGSTASLAPSPRPGAAGLAFPPAAANAGSVCSASSAPPPARNMQKPCGLWSRPLPP